MNTFIALLACFQLFAHIHVESSDVTLSKRLSWLLRHGAIKEQLSMMSDGFVPVSEVLNHRIFKEKLSVDGLKRLVKNNDKQRFTLCTSADGELLIRANQGHSIQAVTDLELTRINGKVDVPGGFVVHGTYEHCWPSIVNQGLSRMSRVHIHFCAYEPDDKRIISGLRKSAQIYIYIDVDKAIKDGIPFFKSANDVILSPGNEEGFIKPVYFLKVVHAKTGDLIKV